MDARASPISTANLRNRPTESGRRTLKKALARRVRHSSAYRLRELARKVAQHDQAIGILFEHIQGLLEPPEPPKKHPVGFRVTDDDKH